MAYNGDNFMDEIPVKNANGGFDVVAVATRGFDADLPAQAGANNPAPTLPSKGREANSPSFEEGARGRFSEEGTGNIYLPSAARGNNNLTYRNLNISSARNPRLGSACISAQINTQSNNANQLAELRCVKPNLLQPPAPAVIKDNKPVFMISAEDEEEVKKLSGGRDGQEGKKGEEGKDGKDGIGGKEGEGGRIKIREIERARGNIGVNFDDLEGKRNKVDKDAEEKVGKIMGEIRNWKLEIGEGLRHPIRLSLRASSEGATEERLKDPAAYASRLGILRPPGAWAQNDALDSRFKNLLRTRIKGARNNIELWQMLVKKSEEGGIGMNEKDADMVIKIVSGVLDKVLSDESERIKKQELGMAKGKQKEASSIRYQVSGEGSVQEGMDKLSLSAAAENTPVTQFTKGEENGNSPASPFNKEKDVILEGIAGEDIKEKLEEKNGEKKDKEGGMTAKVPQKAESGNEPPSDKGESKIPSPFLKGDGGDFSEAKTGNLDLNGAARPGNRVNFYSLNRPAGSSGKAKIEDIKYKPKLMGPVEEIGALRITDFRSLSDDPHHAAEILKSRIDGLEDDSFTKKMEGIAAWRGSEVNKIYLEMGRRAIVENKTIKKVSEYLREKGENYLNNEEFNAIMDLNRRLRF